MTDILADFVPNSLDFDILLDGFDLASHDGLKTAVLMSLFTDRRAGADDVLPDNTRDLRGWWADGFAEISDDKIGSRRWLLSRAKLTAETLKRLKDYDTEALQWLIDDGVAKAVNVTVVRQDPHTALETITIDSPDGSVRKYDYIWRALNGL